MLMIFSAAPSYAQTSVDQQREVIGTVVLVKGIVTGGAGGQASRDLVVGAPVYRGDIVETGRRSFVAIRFNDDGKLTLQPSSSIELANYEDGIGKEAQTFKLLKGGLRAITGKIGKRSPENVKYLARSIMLGIRGTKFAMRLCSQGAQGCRFDRGVSYAGRIEPNQPAFGKVQLWVQASGSGNRSAITRAELDNYLGDIFVSVMQGNIYLLNNRYTIDMEVVDDCGKPPPGTEPPPAGPGSVPGQHPPCTQTAKPPARIPPPGKKQK